MASHGSDTPTSPRAILHHTDTILCTFMHTTVHMSYNSEGEGKGKKIVLNSMILKWDIIKKEFEKLIEF